MNRLTMLQVACLTAFAKHEPEKGSGGGGGAPSKTEVKMEDVPVHGHGVPAGTEIASAGSTAVVAAGPLSFEEDAGRGLEGADKDSFAIPFILVLQPLSPAVVEQTVPGAAAGMLMNSVTNELFKELYLVPCAFQRRWIRWGAREAGGGFKGEFTTVEAMAIRERGEVKELEGRLYYPAADGSINPKRDDRLVDTRTHFVMGMAQPGSDMSFPAALPLSSSGVKISKNFMSRIDGIKLRRGGKPEGELFTPPAFSHVYRLSTTLEKNEKGSWFQPQIVNVMDEGKPLAVKNAALYARAKKFSTEVVAGAVQVAHETMNKADGAGSTDSDGKF